jgi:hypothetical protein
MYVDDDNAVGTSKSTTNELTAYLADPHVGGVTDVLRWWYQNAKKYPILSRMAKDYLSMPRKSSFCTLLSLCLIF